MYHVVLLFRRYKPRSAPLYYAFLKKSFRLDACQLAEPLAQEYWINPAFLQRGVAVGGICPWTTDRYRYRLGLADFNFTFQAGSSRDLGAHFSWCMCKCTEVCVTWLKKKKKKRPSSSVGEGVDETEGAGSFTTLPCTCITHLAEGYTRRFKVSLNIRLSEMQLKKAQNTPTGRRTNGFSVAGNVRPINWETEHDWGPVSNRAGKGRTEWWMTAGQRKGRRHSGKDMRGRWNWWLSI